MPFLLNEDAAIRAKFAGLTVDDANAPEGGRPVDVRFVTPATELATLNYPTILIFYAGVSRDPSREHRGPTNLPYIPETAEFTPEPGETGPRVRDHEGNWVEWDPSADYDPILSPFYVPDHPIPYNIDYRIEVRARTQAHLAALVARLALIDRIPERFGYLEIPEDGTVRSLTMLGGPTMLSAARDADGKRLFQAAYSVRVASELDVYAVSQIVRYVETVDIDLYTLPKQG
jgi:hypothetical protein